MITLTIEENKGDIKFKVGGINTSTDNEKLCYQQYYLHWIMYLE